MSEKKKEKEEGCQMQHKQSKKRHSSQGGHTHTLEDSYESSSFAEDYPHFMCLPSGEEQKACFRDFVKATSTESLRQEVCVVCGQELWLSEGKHQKKKEKGKLTMCG